MCFMREWKTGLAHKMEAPMLSQYTVGGDVSVTPTSVRSEQIHRSSAVVFATARYSASVEERATPFGFFEVHTSR